MSTTLRFIASTSASCFHAAEAIAAGRPLADAALQAALDQPVRDLAAALVAGGVPAAAFWSHIVPLSAGIAANRELADVALAKTIGRGERHAPLVPRFAEMFTALEAACSTTLPELMDQLELRSAPLREQWDARGPGTLLSIGRLTEQALLVEQADVILIHPALGGGGAAHLPYNSVRLEAVLANPFAQLPEIVRLAWLIAQLHCDLPLHQGDLPRDTLARMARLAMLPAAVQAGEEVELNRFDEATLRLALEAWLPDEAGDERVAGTVIDWWDTYRDSRPRWSVALAALERMLAAASVGDGG